MRTPWDLARPPALEEDLGVASVERKLHTWAVVTTGDQSRRQIGARWHVVCLST